MSSANPSKEVILCRGIIEHKDTDDDYVKTFQTAGYTCRHLSVLNFKFFNLEGLRRCLLSPKDYGGLIVTSRRTIEAIELALGDLRLPDEWANLPSFCVGPATASVARAKLNLRERSGTNCGNSKELANRVISKVSRDTKPLLYPCSAIASDTIETILQAGFVGLEKIFVYDTLPSDRLDDDLATIDDGAKKIFVFFSPSAVEYTLKAAREKTRFMENILAAAIGPATAEALVREMISVRAVSSKPEPEALLEAIRAADL